MDFTHKVTGSSPVGSTTKKIKLMKNLNQIRIKLKGRLRYLLELLKNKKTTSIEEVLAHNMELSNSLDALSTKIKPTKFEVDFNREDDDKCLREIGAYLESTDSKKYPPFERYVINLYNFDELADILKKVDASKKGIYSAIISFDPPTIYFNKDI